MQEAMLAVQLVAAVQISQQVALEPRLAMRPSPALLAATSMLALPSVELEQAVERELAENPALERVECASCDRCGRPLAGPGCDRCERPRRPAPVVGATIERAAAEPTAAETLLCDVTPLLAAPEREIAVYLLDSLDERGYLDTTVEEVAEALAVDERRVECVLRVVQDSGPPGVAARDLRECLLLQLDRVSDGDPLRALARRIVDRHLALLGRGLYGELAHALGVERSAVLAARDFVRTHLRPYPALAGPGPPALPLVPDVVVREHEGGLTVELVEPERFRLAVSPSYEQAAVTLPSAERAAVQRQLLAAGAFVNRLEQRWSTMRAVAEVAVARQHEFVRRGPRHLVPLTRAEVAVSLGIHESTVSRAVAGRNLALPTGRIVPLARLFDAAAAPRDALARLLAEEESPKSDAELADDLAELGFALARRTVAKYRERLGVLPAALR